MCVRNACKCFKRKKKAWYCSMLALLAIVVIFYLGPGLRKPEIMSTVGFSYMGAVVIICCVFLKNNSEQSVETLTDHPPKYEVLAVPHLKGQHESTPGSAAINMDLEDPELPSYDTAVLEPLQHSSVQEM